MFAVSFDGRDIDESPSVLVQLAMPVVTASASPEIAKNGDLVTITAESSESGLSVSADVSMLDSTQTEMISLVEADGTYIGSFTISNENEADDGPQTITVTATDGAGNSGTPEDPVTVTLDNTAPVVTASASPEIAKNGDLVTITAESSESGLSVSADVSMLDSTQTEMISLMEADGTYIGSFTISNENEADDGPQTITVMATDGVGNSGTPEDPVTVTLDNTDPVVTASASPEKAANGDEVTITAESSESGLSVSADVSMLDSTQTEMISLVEADGSYIGSFTIRMRTKRRTVPKRLP